MTGDSKEISVAYSLICNNASLEEMPVFSTLVNKGSQLGQLWGNAVLEEEAPQRSLA